MRLLGPGDELLLRQTLEQDRYYNLFMLGDLEAVGIGHADLHYWGQFSRQALVGVLMRWRRNWCLYDAGGADLGRFAAAVDRYPESRAVSGRPILVDAIVGRLRRYEVGNDHHSYYYCALPGGAKLTSPAHPTRRATHEDVDALVAHFCTAGEMRRDADRVRFSLEHNRIFVAEAAGQIVATALSTVETRDLAMVGGVFTPAPWRNRGYATAAVSALCASLVADGRQPCLFYDNPAASSIYRKLGFSDIGQWRVAFLRRAETESRATV